MHRPDATGGCKLFPTSKPKPTDSKNQQKTLSKIYQNDNYENLKIQNRREALLLLTKIPSLIRNYSIFKYICHDLVSIFSKRSRLSGKNYCFHIIRYLPFQSFMSWMKTLNMKFILTCVQSCQLQYIQIHPLWEVAHVKYEFLKAK